MFSESLVVNPFVSEALKKDYYYYYMLSTKQDYHYCSLKSSCKP